MEWERWLSAVIRRKCQTDPPPLVILRRHREKGLLGIRENRRFPAHFDRFIPFLYVFFPSRPAGEPFWHPNKGGGGGAWMYIFGKRRGRRSLPSGLENTFITH